MKASGLIFGILRYILVGCPWVLGALRRKRRLSRCWDPLPEITPVVLLLQLGHNPEINLPKRNKKITNKEGRKVLMFINGQRGIDQSIMGLPWPPWSLWKLSMEKKKPLKPSNISFLISIQDHDSRWDETRWDEISNPGLNCTIVSLHYLFIA